MTIIHSRGSLYNAQLLASLSHTPDQRDLKAIVISTFIASVSLRGERKSAVSSRVQSDPIELQRKI